MSGSYFLHIQKVGSVGSRLDQSIDISRTDASEAVGEVGSRLDQPPTDPWAKIPRNMRSIVRVYINSEMSQDRERAMQLCAKYGLDYVAMRKVIMDEMCATARNSADAS